MEKFPHYYRVSSSAEPRGLIKSFSDSDAAALDCGPPLQFGGERGYWTPEHLLTLSVVSCFVLTFKAIASSSGIQWIKIDCEAEGTLDKVERQVRFSGFLVNATVTLPVGGDKNKVVEAMEKAEQNCLVTNSLNCPVHLNPRIEMAD